MTSSDRQADSLNGELKCREISSSLVFYSLLAGATALIPLPLLDDWAFGVVRRAMWRDQLGRAGLGFDKQQIRYLLSRRVVSGQGCVYRMLFFTLVLPFRVLGYLIRGIFRKLLYFLAVKQASDLASWSFHEGFLLEFAASRGHVNDLESLAVVRQTIETTLHGVTTSPITAVFRRVLEAHRRLLRKVGRRLIAVGRLEAKGEKPGDPRPDSLWEEERRTLDALVHRVADLLGGEEGYLGQLASRFEAMLQAGWKSPRVPPPAQISDSV